MTSTKDFRENKFNLANTEAKVFDAAGSDRHDISVTGSVNVVIDGLTVNTLTNEVDNLFYDGEFSLVATGGAASGSVISIKEGS